jgi:hypothetical protein
MIRMSKSSNVARATQEWSLVTTSGLERTLMDLSWTICWRKKNSDAKQVEPAITRLVEEQSLPVKSVWGGRGLHSAANQESLKSREIRSALYPRDVKELSERFNHEPGMREGLERRAGAEARISIITRKFMGTPARAKGFKHRDRMLGWAVLGHNLWKLARLPQKEARQAIPPDRLKVA